MVFSPEYLRQQLDLLPEAKRYLVGYSGGLDSHVLLTALSQLDLETPVIAVHVDHSIDASSDQWQQHCALIASDLKIDFQSRKVNANPPTGESPEAWAREKRYEVFSALMEEGDILLLAHHQDDQIETFFLQLLRGSGPHGLSAMPRVTDFNGGWIARPCLDVKRKDLERYAQEQKLEWIEDPSNQDIDYDRNYLRHEIIPLIRERWPGYAGNLSRSISLQSDACSILDDTAEHDLQLTQIENSSYLSVQKLLELNDVRIRNLLRYWIKVSGFPLPSSRKLRQMIDTVLVAADDRTPCVEWSGVEVRRYRDQLMIMISTSQHDPLSSYTWDLKQALELPTGVLTAKKTTGQGLKLASEVVAIRFRQGGEEFKPAGQQHTKTLKKYLQEQAVPPWLRNQIPLIYCDDQLVAVSDLCFVDQFVAGENEEGWSIHFEISERV